MTKKIWSCGIRRERKPSATKKIVPSTMNGAESSIGEAERGADQPRRRVRQIAEAGELAGREQAVAGDQAAQHQMMGVGEEDQQHAEDGEEGAR